MPLGIKPICTVCKTSNSTLWRKGSQGEILCNSCGLKQQSGPSKDTKGNNGNSNKSNGNANGGVQIIRKSLRLKPSKHKATAFLKTIPTKGKSRRIIFKKSQPIKAPTAVSTVITGDSVFHEGIYYQKGDVVSLVDHSGSVYYAQIRGFLQDQFNEKSAVLTWLLPTKASPTEYFDPSTYILGPEEELPRKMEFMEFVCHAPSDYYKSPVTPYTTVPMKPELCFIWKPLQDPIRPLPSTDELYGVKDTTIKIEKPEKKEREKIEKKEKEKIPKKDVEKKVEKPVESLQQLQPAKLPPTLNVVNV